MVGPSATEIRSRSAPQCSMAAMVASRTPVAAPRQPAWATPMTPAVSSANRTGPQSAVVTPMASPGTAVTIASARGPSCGRPGRAVVTHSGEWARVGGEQALRLPPERRRQARAVLRHLGGSVVGARPAVEARIDAVGHAAFAGEEGVADAGEGAEGCGLEHLCHLVMPGLLVA